ncbi:adenosine kinase [Fulvimarina sp. 2208YS6-2-32]|uniref:Adenosine kinase n=1 Tax=Fulvimarina uroteuthidis TaxID=3098149 RepID=A0ABU5HYA6_9HYPH|nr:adenosine kinase [Fulvimarina sp. 2208YS6-2-32]MDY8108035.1 adenosine kinase [Fulvimarina sp. 2208YS6-2-32]
MAEYDLLCIGNAIVDVISPCEEEFLVENAIQKGGMTLIDTERAEALYAAMSPGTEASGGSAANTIACFASLGGKGAFIGKVADDQLGTIFNHDIHATGITFETAPNAGDGAPTARCLILVTPDGERSMNTFLGACTELGPQDIDEDLVKASKVTYFEGYLWDPPKAKEAIVKAAHAAHAAGRQVAMTLSDDFCVARYRNEFLDLLRSGTVDIVFANETEALALYETDNLDEALDRLGRDAPKLAIVTRGEKGCIIVEGQARTVVPASPVDKVVDATGAGDAFAGGYLMGHIAGMPREICGRLAVESAAHVIAKIGARPQRPLKDLPAIAEILAS